MAIKHNVARGSEEYVKGRRGGVSGPEGAPRSEDSHAPVGSRVAQKTVYPGERNSDGGGEDGLGEKASSLYRKAVRNEPDKIGDQALTER